MGHDDEMESIGGTGVIGTPGKNGFFHGRISLTENTMEYLVEADNAPASYLNNSRRNRRNCAGECTESWDKIQRSRCIIKRASFVLNYMEMKHCNHQNFICLCCSATSSLYRDLARIRPLVDLSLVEVLA